MDLSEYQTATAEEMGKLIRKSPSAIYKLLSVSPEKLPPHFRIGKSVLFPLDGPSGFSAWLASRVQGGGLANG
jgi:predicted DNA-binding transcriptional regulator AlpA